MMVYEQIARGGVYIHAFLRHERGHITGTAKTTSAETLQGHYLQVKRAMKNNVWSKLDCESHHVYLAMIVRVSSSGGTPIGIHNYYTNACLRAKQ